MNMNLIEKALMCYAQQELDASEKYDAITALQEIACVQDMHCDESEDDAVVIPTETWSDILSALTYDILGKRLRKFDGSMHFDFYVHDVREKVPGMDAVPARYLEIGYDFLSDLWHDNETEGSNNPDGTFNRLSK